MERLYAGGRADLFRLAWLVVGDAGVAEDLVQEAYTRLWTHPERVQDATRVEAYVRSIVLNLARTRFSTRARRRHVDTRLHGDPTGAGKLPDTDPMRGADDRAVLRDALDALSTKQRACVVCRYWLGLTDAEVALATGMALGTVKTHLRRALSRLRADLDHPSLNPLEDVHVHRR